jgi:signal peptidase II
VSSAPSPAAPPAVSAPPPRRRVFFVLIGLITIPVIVLDQLTKLIVRTHMMLYESIAIIPNWLDLTYTRNAGAAFSMFVSLPPWFRIAFLASLASIALVVLVVLLIQAERVTINSVAFAFILAGAAGNLIDRAFHHGEVTDFIRVHYYALNYPVFNVADSAISIGVTLIIIGALFVRSDPD